MTLLDGRLLTSSELLARELGDLLIVATLMERTLGITTGRLLEGAQFPIDVSGVATCVLDGYSQVVAVLHHPVQVYLGDLLRVHWDDFAAGWVPERIERKL